MKVYVDELPESCSNCSCLNADCDYGCSCNLNAFLEEEHFDIDKKPDNCPLQSLTDYTKQVRKEVVDEIRKTLFEYLKVNSMQELESLSLLDGTLTYDVITDKLDQIQGEING